MSSYPVQKLAILLIPSLVMIALHLMGDSAASSLSFISAKIKHGEWWRYLSGHFVHFTLYHTAMNVFGLSMVAYFMFLEKSVKIYYLSLIFICLGASFGLYMDSELHEYRGFSGAFYGVLVFACILNFNQSRLTMIAIIGIVVGKIILEQRPGYDVNYLKEQIDVAVAIDAHLWGVLSGLGCGGIYALFTYAYKLVNRSKNLDDVKSSDQNEEKTS